jgi:cephalosporin hydroxylase
VVRRFHDLYIARRGRIWGTTFWRGVRTRKCPLDLWVYQEIIVETRPDVIIETGTDEGGSALFMAAMCDLAGHGRVVTIDIAAKATPTHPRVRYISGDSVSPQTFADVTREIAPEESAMVVLDSSHSRAHVLRELRLWERLVRKGHYVIVEDTNMNLRLAVTGRTPRPGAFEAVQEFLAQQDRFEIDRSREKFMLTWNPCGYLRCVAD